MNNAPKVNTGDSDLARWAKGVQQDANQNQPVSNPDFNRTTSGKGTSMELGRKFKREWGGFYIPEKGVNYDATGSYFLNEIAQVKDGTTYVDSNGDLVPAEVGTYVCIKHVPPEDSSHVTTAATIYPNIDYSNQMRSGSVIYYPVAAGNDYWLPLGGGAGTSNDTGVWY